MNNTVSNIYLGIIATKRNRQSFVLVYGRPTPDGIEGENIFFAIKLASRKTILSWSSRLLFTGGAHLSDHFFFTLAEV